MSKIQVIIEQAAPTLAGMLLAANARTDIGVVVGAACAGSGIMGLLGMLVSEAVVALRVPKLIGMRRLLANWLCGLSAIPITPYIHRTRFPNEDLALTAAGISGVASLLGVSILFIALPALLNILSKTINRAETKWTENTPTETEKPKQS